MSASSPAPRSIWSCIHGVLAPHARWRSQVVRYGRPAPDVNARELEASLRAAGTPGAWTWAALMRRVFDLDVLACPRCGGRLRVLATVQDPAPCRPSSPTWPAPAPPRRPAPPHPPPPHSRSPRLSSALDAAPDSRHRTPLPAPCPRPRGGAGRAAGDRDADPHLRPLEAAVADPPPGSPGSPDRSDARCPSGGGVSRSYAPPFCAWHGEGKAMAGRRRLRTRSTVAPSPYPLPLGAGEGAGRVPSPSTGEREAEELPLSR